MSYHVVQHHITSQYIALYLTIHVLVHVKISGEMHTVEIHSPQVQTPELRHCAMRGQRDGKRGRQREIVSLKDRDRERVRESD